VITKATTRNLDVMIIVNVDPAIKTCADVLPFFPPTARFNLSKSTYDPSRGLMALHFLFERPTAHRNFGMALNTTVDSPLQFFSKVNTVGLPSDPTKTVNVLSIFRAIFKAIPHPQLLDIQVNKKIAFIHCTTVASANRIWELKTLQVKDTDGNPMEYKLVTSKTHPFRLVLGFFSEFIYLFEDYVREIIHQVGVVFHHVELVENKRNGRPRPFAFVYFDNAQDMSDALLVGLIPIPDDPFGNCVSFLPPKNKTQIKSTRPQISIPEEQKE